ncbi:MAG: response regulator, partial [Lutibacter sp.]|nr:response regulator [Lutibacter sp.]
SITDTGIGIPEDKIATIFENFQQASTGTSKIYGGTGLGLAIAKQLVESQRGSISVKSKIDQGSTFSFKMNFQKTTKEVKENIEIQITPSETETKKMKVLVVEDIALNQLLMKTLLDDFGFKCEIASNGKIAIEKLQNNNYDVILMDLQMPEMDGFEATGYIRNTMNLNIPIIALTANVTTVDLEKCKAVGMNDYISKPVEELILYKKIIDLVKKPSDAKEKSDVNIKDEQKHEKSDKLKCTDLTYLIQRTKSNQKLLLEMISIYLEQTPPILFAMKQSVTDNDWPSLHKAVHKLIPSFTIMGISADFENMAKKVQEYARDQENTDEIPDLVVALDKVCSQACEELTEVFDGLKEA